MSTIEQVLEAAMRETFATILDQEPLAPATRVPALPSSAGLTSQVRFTGSFCGTLLVHCRDSVAATLAQRMLGTQAAVSDADARDAVGELANIVTGLTLRHLCDVASSCHLGLPQRGAPPAELGGESTAWCVLHFPCGPDVLVLAAQVHPS